MDRVIDDQERGERLTYAAAFLSQAIHAIVGPILAMISRASPRPTVTSASLAERWTQVIHQMQRSIDHSSSKVVAADAFPQSPPGAEALAAVYRRIAEENRRATEELDRTCRTALLTASSFIELEVQDLEAELFELQDKAVEIDETGRRPVLPPPVDLAAAYRASDDLLRQAKAGSWDVLVEKLIADGSVALTDRVRHLAPRQPTAPLVAASTKRWEDVEELLARTASRQGVAARARSVQRAISSKTFSASRLRTLSLPFPAISAAVGGPLASTSALGHSALFSAGSFLTTRLVEIISARAADAVTAVLGDPSMLARCNLGNALAGHGFSAPILRCALPPVRSTIAPWRDYYGPKSSAEVSASVLRALGVGESRFWDVNVSGVAGEDGHFGFSTYEAVAAFQQEHKLIRAVASGLADVRRNEWVHRDVKPSNILHDLTCQRVLIDLGVAQPLRERSLDWPAVPGSTASVSCVSMRSVEMVQRALGVLPGPLNQDGSYSELSREAATVQRWEVEIGLGGPGARHVGMRGSGSGSSSREDSALLVADGSFVIAQVKGHDHASYPRSWLPTVLPVAPTTIVVLVYRAEARQLIGEWSTSASPEDSRSTASSRPRQQTALSGARSTVHRHVGADLAYASKGRGINREEYEKAGMEDKVDKAYESKSINEIADAPVEALQGISEGDAKHLKDAFNVKTVRDLGTNKYFLWAQAIAKIAE